MSRIENLKKQYIEANAKKKSIESHIAAMEVKKRNIDISIEADRRKLEKLNFFLSKTLQTIQSSQLQTTTKFPAE